MLTLEEAAEAQQIQRDSQNNRSQRSQSHRSHRSVDGVEDDTEREAEDGQFDPADYTDHLYDSDGGSAQ